MLINIRAMQKEKKGKLEELVNKDGEKARRTTIILEKEEREFIDSLIQEGKEPGIKPLISKMIDIYRSMMIHDWHFPGEYYWGISRMAFVNVELLDILIQQVPIEKRRAIGRKLGETMKIALETTSGGLLKDREGWKEVFKRLRVQGFGDLYLKDKYILIKTPFISQTEIWTGILEGLLDTELDTKTKVPPIVLEIKEKASTTK
jgi:hypothetical protein